MHEPVYKPIGLTAHDPSSSLRLFLSSPAIYALGLGGFSHFFFVLSTIMQVELRAEGLVAL